MLYFAYGSNMDWQQMKERCPSARFVGVAVMRDHKLGFTRESTRRGCGVADAVAEDGRSLWGVVYEITDLDLSRLDISEGYMPGRNKNSYWRREQIVYASHPLNYPITVVTYFAEREDNPPMPNETYKNQILEGARYWHLPAEYIAELENIEVARCPLL